MLRCMANAHNKPKCFVFVHGAISRVQYMDRGGFDEALDSLDGLIADYAELGEDGRNNEPRDGDTRLRPVF